MNVLESFFGNGRRLELFKSGGYALHRFGGEIRGYDGELDCMVGFKLQEYELRRLLNDAEKYGWSVCSTWIPKA